MTAPQSIRDLLVARWGVPLVPSIRPSVTITPAAPQQILKQDAARVAVLIVNSGGNVVTLQPTPVFPSGSGPRIDPNGGSLFLVWDEDGETVAYEWFAESVGAPTSLWVYEVLIDQGRVTPAPAAA